MDLLELIHTEQHREFKERSGLLKVHPEAHITFSRPMGYGQLLEIIEAHAYQLSMARATIVPMPEATADWHETSWLPAMEAIQSSGVAARFSFKTDADRYLWVHDKLRQLRASDHFGRLGGGRSRACKGARRAASRRGDGAPAAYAATTNAQLGNWGVRGEW